MFKLQEKLILCHFKIISVVVNAKYGRSERTFPSCLSVKVSILTFFIDSSVDSCNEIKPCYQSMIVNFEN